MPGHSGQQRQTGKKELPPKDLCFSSGSALDRCGRALFLDGKSRFLPVIFNLSVSMNIQIKKQAFSI